MPRCSRRGCGKDYELDTNTDTSCAYHTGDPVFHEGLKSWSCCSDVNKPVMEFEQFMALQGCNQGVHLEHVPTQPALPKAPPNTTLKLTASEDGKEAYSTKSILPPKSSTSLSPSPKPEPIIVEEDDLTIPVYPGTTCKRKGCFTVFVSDGASRTGEGEGTVCMYHPMPPIFHEGSKGYLCCKRRVLEFDEFLKIGGCKQGRHLFAPKSKMPTAEEFTNCRIDHFQTPQEVHVSVFAKQVDKERSTINFQPDQIHLDLYLAGSKRFRRALNLFGPIDPDSSSFQVYGTKVELLLKKQDGRSWTVLEQTAQDLGNIQLTFGVGGRVGTVGSDKIILDPINQSQNQA